MEGLLKKAVLTISLCMQMLLIGGLSFYIYSTREKGGLLEDIFTDSFAVAEVDSDLLSSSSVVETEGEVVPASGYVSISSPLEGVVEQAFVERGSEVQKGAPLFKMEDSSLYVEVKQKEEQLRGAQAELAFKKMGASPFALKAKQKELEEASLRKNQGEKEASLFKDLLQEMAVSTVECDEKQLLAQLAEKEYEKKAAEMEALSSPMTKKEEAIYLHQIEEKKAALKQSALKLQHAMVRAPITGKVVEVKALPGSLLQGKKSCGVVMAGTQLMVKVTLLEEQAYQIKRGVGLMASATIPRSGTSYSLKYHSYNPKLSVYKDGERKLELFFTFVGEEPNLYLGQSLKVSLGASDKWPFL